MNWPLTIVIAIFAFAFIAFLIMRNFKDEKEFAENLGKDLSKHKRNEGDIVIDKSTK